MQKQNKSALAEKAAEQMLQDADVYKYDELYDAFSSKRQQEKESRLKDK